MGLAEAARLTGKNQSTIHRAMRSGRLSFTIAPDGTRRIDVAELERAFGIKHRGNGAMPGNNAATMQSHSAHGSEIAALQARIAEQARILAAQSDVICDYQHRLDTSEAERREAQARLTALVTHRQSGTVPTVHPAPARGPWWRRWF